MIHDREAEPQANFTKMGFHNLVLVSEVTFQSHQPGWQVASCSHPSDLNSCNICTRTFQWDEFTGKLAI